MHEQPPPTRLLSEALWRRRDLPSLEHCRLMEVQHATIIQGSVVAMLDSQPCHVGYMISCDPDWSTRTVAVTCVSGDTTRRLQLRRSESGEWWQDDVRLPEFDGLVDIDVSISPSTNTLPIRRLNLASGASATTDALWVRFPHLALERLPQRYTRIDEHRYVYESRNGSFRADLEVDREALVVRYGDIWERVTS